jgi:hypothetical protein
MHRARESGRKRHAKPLQRDMPKGTNLEGDAAKEEDE